MAAVVPLSPRSLVDAVPELETVAALLVGALEPISPELCLVDPGLAERARSLLPEPVARAPLVVAVEAHAAPSPPVAELREPTRRSRRRLLALAGAALALAVAVSAWVGPESAGGGEQGATDRLNLFVPPTDPSLAPDAVAALEQQVRATPGSVVVREKLGIVYLRLQRWEDAERELRALVVLAPNDRFARFALGRALDEQGRRAEAREQFALARKLAPSLP
jgi:tetratricopeptide (TPR) repeat protein